MSVSYGIERVPPPPTRRITRRRNPLFDVLRDLAKSGDREVVRVARFDSPTGASRAARGLEMAVKNGVRIGGVFDVQPRVIYDADGNRVGSGLWVQLERADSDGADLADAS